MKDKSLNISKYKGQRFLFGKSHASSSIGKNFSWFKKSLYGIKFLTKKELNQLQGFVDVGENDKCVVSEHEIRKPAIIRDIRFRL